MRHWQGGADHPISATCSQVGIKQLYGAFTTVCTSAVAAELAKHHYKIVLRVELPTQQLSNFAHKLNFYRGYLCT